MPAQSKPVDSAAAENEALQGLPKPKHIIDGIPFTFKASDAHIDAVMRIKNLEYRPTDVLLAGYPRTGTTWTLAILWLIMHDADVETFSKLSPNDRVCRMDYVHAGEESNLSRLDRGVYPDPRILMTHSPYEFLAPNFKKAGIKVVYTMRNPKDTLVSYYHASRTFEKANVQNLVGKEPDFDSILKYTCSPIADRGPIFKQIRKWWEDRENPQIYFSFYEDKIRDPRGAVKNLATFLEKDLSEEQIDAILEATGISTMRATYAKYGQQQGFEQNFNTTGGIRKGEIGGWKDQFTVEQSEWLDAQIEQNLGGMGLNFQYE